MRRVPSKVRETRVEKQNKRRSGCIVEPTNDVEKPKAEVKKRIDEERKVYYAFVVVECSKIRWNKKPI